MKAPASAQFQGLARVLERLAELPGPEEALSLRPSAELQACLGEQLRKNREEGYFMKTLELAGTDLERCVKEARSESVLVIKNGKPLALIANVEGLDAEQIQLGTSPDFWKLIEVRRRQKTVPWNELKARLAKLDE